MLCDDCKKNDATIHIQEIAGKKRRAIHLCAVCAAHKGVPMTGELPSDLDIPQLLLSLTQQVLPAASATVRDEAERSLQCGRCGLTAAELRQQGRLGCPDCYQTFAAMLMPILAGMHRGLVHAGKRPTGEPAVAQESPSINPALLPPPPPVSVVATAIPPPPSLAELQAALALAIGKEDYESAAKLRDEIRRRG